MARDTGTQQHEAGAPAAPKPNAWRRFSAHTPRYRATAAAWLVSVFLVPVSFVFHSIVATGAAILLTWLAIHAFRRADMEERRARRSLICVPPAPGRS